MLWERDTRQYLRVRGGSKQWFRWALAGRVCGEVQQVILYRAEG